MNKAINSLYFIGFCFTGQFFRPQSLWFPHRLAEAIWLTNRTPFMTSKHAEALKSR